MRRTGTGQVKDSSMDVWKDTGYKARRSNYANNSAALEGGKEHCHDA
jgi:hypothetical protein